MKTRKNLTLAGLFIITLFCFSFAETTPGISSPRQKERFDFDWKFSKGDFPKASKIDFDDSNWRQIDIPHDWSILDSFSKENPTQRSGGYASGGIGWYRKRFTLNNKKKSSKIAIEFGGVYENSEVWINGHYLGKRPYGYISFNYDLTPYLNFKGENVLAVRVDNSKQPSARWYTGCGIYRHVWLIGTGKLHIARFGVYATTPVITPDSAIVKVKTKVENDFDKAKQYRVINEIYSSKGELISRVETPGDIPGNGKQEIVQKMPVNNPGLWSPDSPVLYKLKTIIKNRKTVYDQLETNIGIRDFNFSAHSGFTLNGKNMKFKGVNNHSDLGALGAALNDRVLERRLEILKAMGCNAIRTAHNPPSEELLDMCDKMGFMVMDEAFDEWLESWSFRGVKKPEGKVKYGYHLHYNQWAEKDLTELIGRDRNHPSIIIWSVGNEIPDACLEIGTERLKRLMKIVRKEDPTRPITCGITHMHLANKTGFAGQLDITGYNGGGGTCFMYEKDHKTYPQRKFLATEVPHTFQTRGVYRTQSWYRGKNPLGGIMKVPDLANEEVFPGVSKFYSSSYDNAMVRISARDSWRRTRDLPYLCGEFRWTGFDYLGETMFGWPARFWNFGIIDMCGFPKDTYYFYQSQWTEEPMVHILPHWNWEGKEGVEIPVVAYSNCDSVELFLNGNSLGEKVMGDKMDLVWQIPYEPGLIKAKGKKDGRVVCIKEVATSGRPAKIQLLADRRTIAADGRDVVHIEVNILDAKDRFVPDASNDIFFKVEGEATILAVDNGDPKSEEPFFGNSRKAFNGKCLVILKSTKKKGEFNLYARSGGLKSAKVSFRSNYKNKKAKIEDRVADLLEQMTVDEKVSQMRMFHANKGIDFSDNGKMELSDDVKQRLIKGIGGSKGPGEHLSPSDAASLNNQLQKYIIENNRLGIPAFFVTESYNGVDAEGCTRFGRPITLSSSWNKELVKEVYSAIGREARLRGLHLTHSPVADIARDPRFGRMSEGFGEDTHLTTEMIVNAVSGLQGDYKGLTSTHIGAVTKHFAGYAQVAGGTNFASVEISPRTLIDEIFPPFKAAVLRANTLGIMASHGDINGVACHSNPWLLTEVLRNQWGFEGYTVSDANDIGRLHYFMKVAETPKDAVRLSLKAGMDVDLYADDAYALLPEMVKENPGLEKYIDRSAGRVLRTKFILGLFDNPFQNPKEAKVRVRDAAAIDLAHKADLESIILLKNKNRILPLPPGKKMKIALVGPILSEETKSYFEQVAGNSCQFIAEKGFDLTDKNRAIPKLTPVKDMENGIRKIVSKSQNSDFIVLFLGGDKFTSKEAFFGSALGDRESIYPVGLQDKLLQELKKTGKPVVVVLKHRRTLAVNIIAEKADAILDCWELSEFGDRAVAKIIFGLAVPSGKLSVTVPRSIGQIPFHYSQKEINYKKGYLFIENTPLFSFGFGLSYTSFEYSNLKLSGTSLSADGSITAAIDVKNIGKTAGKEVVQLYIKDVIGSVLRPGKELKGFEKISLEPDETKTVSFDITPGMLAFTGPGMKETIENGEYIVMLGGSSTDLSSLSFRLSK